MTPQDRVKRYAQIAAASALLVWLLLCYFLLVSPKRAALARVSEQLDQASTKVAEMKREIEDAGIAGPLPVGASRFDKFGILGFQEEQLFLSDLIDFCTESDNTLNLVRRADVGRPAKSETPSQRKSEGKDAESATTKLPDGTEVPRPVIERVPHTVTFSGTFLSSFYLLRKLESYKRLLTVERVELLTDHHVGYPRLNGTVTIDLYLVKGALPRAAAVSAAEAPAVEESGEPRLSEASVSTEEAGDES